MEKAVVNRHCWAKKEVSIRKVVEAMVYVKTACHKAMVWDTALPHVFAYTHWLPSSLPGPTNSDDSYRKNSKI